jgi:hypothetical protein
VRWTSTLQRLFVEDVRENQAFLRVTVHEDAGVVVVSHWQGDVCVAATRIALTAVPDLIELLAAALDAHEESGQVRGRESTPFVETD